MKKILTLAIMALLMGGLTFTANAQERGSKKEGKKEAKKEVVKTKRTAAKDTKTAKFTKTKGKTNWDSTIKDYETTVETCVKYFEEMKNPKAGKNVTKKFEDALAKAEKLKGQLEQAKGDLDRTQTDRVNKATQKLQVVYTKG